MLEAKNGEMQRNMEQLSATLKEWAALREQVEQVDTRTARAAMN